MTDFTDTDQAALDEAKRAGVTSPAAIGDTHQADAGELQMRVQSLEAMVKHIYSSLLRTADVQAIITAHAENLKGSDVLVKGP